MASLMCRSLSQISRRTALVACARSSSEGGLKNFDHHGGKIASDKVDMPDGLGHAVGLERWELLAKLAGHEDPFELNPRTRAEGTHDKPTLIPSVFEKRLIGCLCDDDSIAINWMYVHKGESKRCMCGHFFKLVQIEPVDYSK